jgi:hypothetical protein
MYRLPLINTEISPFAGCALSRSIQLRCEGVRRWSSDFFFLFQVLLLCLNFTTLEMSSLSVMAMRTAGFSGASGPQDGGW